MHEQKFENGSEMLVRIRHSGSGNIYPLVYSTLDRQKELLLNGNGDLKVKITQFDCQDNTYDCQPVDGSIGPFWAAFEYLRPLTAMAVKSDGMTCIECVNGYPYAEPNFGDKLVCYSCHSSKGWKYRFANGKVELK